MTAGSQEHERLPLAVEVILYPFHFIARVIARTMLLLAATIGLALASITIFLLLFQVWEWATATSGWRSQEILNALLIAFALLTSLGLLTTVFTEARKALKDAFSEIGRELSELLTGWVPRLNARKSMVAAKDDILEIRPTFKRLFSAPYKLILPLSIVVFLTFLATRIVSEDAKWKKDVRAAAERPTVVLVVPAEGDHTIPTPTLQLGTTFAIAHVNQGSLKTGEGICLDDNISLSWLTAFKAALTQCGTSTPSCRPQIVVRAFASIAPVDRDETEEQEPATRPTQEELNCEIANRRAEEVVNFFLHVSSDKDNTDYKCKAKVDHRAPYGDRTLCKRDEAVFDYGDDDGLAFDLRYEPWQSHEAMVADKPANDGRHSDDQRKHRVEFFNRSVQITLRDYGCDAAECESAAPRLNADEGDEG